MGVAKAGSGEPRSVPATSAEDSLKAHGAFNEASFEKLLPLLKYVDGDYRDPKTFENLRTALDGAKRPLHYLAIPPAFFATVVEGLAKSECALSARVVVEKPFGRDLTSAKQLPNAILEQAFPESAIFRIDCHFLGKEPVQNILYTLSRIFSSNRCGTGRTSTSIQITMAENFGVSGRGAFYERGRLPAFATNGAESPAANPGVPDDGPSAHAGAGFDPRREIAGTESECELRWRRKDIVQRAV